MRIFLYWEGVSGAKFNSEIQDMIKNAAHRYGHYIVYKDIEECDVAVIDLSTWDDFSVANVKYVYGPYLDVPFPAKIPTLLIICTAPRHSPSQDWQLKHNVHHLSVKGFKRELATYNLLDTFFKNLK